MASISGQGTCLGCIFGSQSGCEHFSLMSMFLSLFISHPLSLKSISMFSGEDKKNAEANWKNFPMAKSGQFVQQSEYSTLVPLYLLASELVKSSTHHILTRKIVSAPSACSSLVALVRTCMSHDTTP